MTIERRPALLVDAGGKPPALLVDADSKPSAIGLGCMRLSTARDRDDERSRATLRGAIERGVTWLDTAPSYGQGESDAHHSERLVGSVLKELGEAGDRVRVSTKAGIVRVGERWVPDGRRKTLRASCEASFRALDRPIDVLFLHAPDPATPLATSARALRDLVDDRSVLSAGLSNVSLPALESVFDILDVRAVQIALNPFELAPLRTGLVAKCAARGIRVFAHSPLGGRRRAPRLARDAMLARLADTHGVTPATVVLAWLYHLGVVPLPGATRIETAALAARARSITLGPNEIEAIETSFLGSRARTQVVTSTENVPEIVLVTGIQAAGKSTHVERFVERGYERWNRDERGSSMRALHEELDARLAHGGRRFVVDNTYPTRAARAEAIAIAQRHGAIVRLLLLDTPFEVAAVHAVERMLEHLGRLPTPEDLRAYGSKHVGTFGPHALFRYRRDYEPAALDEGFASIERVPYERFRDPLRVRSGAVFAAELALYAEGSNEHASLRRLLDPTRVDAALAFAFSDASRLPAIEVAVARLAEATGVAIDVAVCLHGGGPPVCWCRPPLPGTVVPWIRARLIDVAKSTLLGRAAPHRALARGVGMRYLAVEPARSA